MKKPEKLTSPRVWRTYMGGRLIDELHGLPGGVDGQFPEEWILSVVHAKNVGREHILDEGLCRIADTGEFLRDRIAADPEVLLGKDHFEKVGATPGVLVKIIDSAERLTIQAHPDKQRAMELFGSPFGKTECWHILGGRSIDGEDPCIYVGFQTGITREYWKQVFDRQDIPAMLGCLHRFPVKAGETYLIPGGVPHAIGAGCLLVEIQEPTDYTVRTERVSPKGLKIKDRQCHQGLGFEKMFDCFSYRGLTEAEAKEAFFVEPKLVETFPRGSRWEVIGAERTTCFRMERCEFRGDWELPGASVMSGLYILEGKGKLYCGDMAQTFQPGEQFFLPAGCERSCLCADDGEKVVLVRCFGPCVSQ